MAVTLAVGGATAPTSFSFTVSQVEDSSLLSTLVTSEFDFFIIIISYVEELSSYHLKEALWGFSVAHSNCQHHYSRPWEPGCRKEGGLDRGIAIP